MLLKHLFKEVYRSLALIPDPIALQIKTCADYHKLLRGSHSRCPTNSPSFVITPATRACHACSLIRITIDNSEL